MNRFEPPGANPTSPGLGLVPHVSLNLNRKLQLGFIGGAVVDRFSWIGAVLMRYDSSRDCRRRGPRIFQGNWNGNPKAGLENDSASHRELSGVRALHVGQGLAPSLDRSIRDNGRRTASPEFIDRRHLWHLMSQLMVWSQIAGVPSEKIGEPVQIVLEFLRQAS